MLVVPFLSLIALIIQSASSHGVIWRLSYMHLLDQPMVVTQNDIRQFPTLCLFPVVNGDKWEESF